jgi:hypothetical protein
MAQAQVKQFPGFGIVYPDGVSGIKIVRTYTQGPSKVINPDGSVGYTTPPPTILELFGGGFAYADGSPVIDRAHLEMVSDLKMREKALKWFDESKKMSEVSRENVPPLNLDEKVRPEPIYVLSTELSTESSPAREELDNTQMQMVKNFEEMRQSMTSITDMVKEQAKLIAELMKPPQVTSQPKGTKQSEVMKKNWADPEWRAKREAKKRGKDVT